MEQKREQKLSFSELLERYMEVTGIGPARLATEANRLSNHPNLVHRTTIRHWQTGAISKVKDWRQLTAVAYVLRLNESEVDQLLTAAGHPPVRQLWLGASDVDRELLIHWTEQAPLQAVGEILKRIQVNASELRETEERFRRFRQVDVVILTVLDEESVAVRHRISGLVAVPGSVKVPNIYGWEIGDIPRVNGGVPYRVVLSQVGHAGNIMSTITTFITVQQWQPRYVFLVGIAGGFAHDGLTLGDVVVSDHIWGYEYGKIRSQTAMFEPRPDFTYRCDIGLINGTRKFIQRNPNWNNAIKVVPPKVNQPKSKVLWGPVASGEKVIDEAERGFFISVLEKSPKLLAVEMEGIGAAAAIDQANAMGYSQGFIMIRGISDMPDAKTEETFDKTAGQSERDLWKLYAAEAAATLTVAYIADGLPIPPRGLYDPEFRNK
ncbi:MAG: hypothetical protein L0332_25540 [Chloroflexi bacterium]|nr:hypothetical protein [Chloroflexota bacterium]MCI0730062.1 hypothetical protein [Chloroflexota bacterium]